MSLPTFKTLGTGTVTLGTALVVVAQCQVVTGNLVAASAALVVVRYQIIFFNTDDVAYLPEFGVSVDETTSIQYPITGDLPVAVTAGETPSTKCYAFTVPLTGLSNGNDGSNGGLGAPHTFSLLAKVDRTSVLANPYAQGVIEVIGYYPTGACP